MRFHRHAHSGALIHCDAAQAIGKIPVNIKELGVDMLSISAHKFYGPKGVGALYIQGGIKNISLQPIIYGGGQENGIRSGTTNVPGIVGLGEAARICSKDLNDEKKRIEKLRKKLEENLKNQIPGLIINAESVHRLPNTSSMIFPNIDADALLLNMPDIMMGTGSACNSGTVEPSHVLQAIGISRVDAYRAIRASLGRFTTQEGITKASDDIVRAFKTLTTL